jgi:hypothetical protein
MEKKIGKEVIKNGHNKDKQSREKERRKKFGMVKERENNYQKESNEGGK